MPPIRVRRLDVGDEVGKGIKSIRKKLEYTQRTFAPLLNEQQKDLSLVERNRLGPRQDIVAKLQALADANTEVPAYLQIRTEVQKIKATVAELVGVTQISTSSVGSSFELSQELISFVRELYRPFEEKEPAPAFTILARDLTSLYRALGEHIFVLRLLPFELTPILFDQFDLGPYDDMAPYRDTMYQIVTLGRLGGMGYWDMSIFGLCGDHNADSSTAYALAEMYFPPEHDVIMTPPKLRPPDRNHRAVNTSMLALSRQSITEGIFLIGNYVHHSKQATPRKYIELVTWEIGFTCRFDRQGEAFNSRWRPSGSSKIVSGKELKKLAQEWCTVWESLQEFDVRPEDNPQTVTSIAINVDELHSSTAPKWRDFIRRWYEGPGP